MSNACSAENSGKSLSLFPELTSYESTDILLDRFYANPVLSQAERSTTLEKAREVTAIARQASELFSAEKIMALYKLSTAEGRLIMELAEALLRVPDSETRNALIFDKLSPGHWFNGNEQIFLRGMGAALQVASGIIRSRYETHLKALILKLGVPVVKMAIEAVMKQMGGQFVFAETIQDGMKYTATKPNLLFSFDMLGEAARSKEDCDRYFNAYMDAVNTVGASATETDVNLNHGVSIKLSALSSRLQTRYWTKSHEDLVQRMVALTRAAKQFNIPITIDVEEFGKLRPTMCVFEHLVLHPDIKGWPGLGIVAQAYARHATPVIDWLEDLAKQCDTKLSVRLVKGAYWDSEIKIAQQKGLSDFPVFTAKEHSDVSYLAQAKRLMESAQWLRPQFATHNAYTLSAVATLAERIKPEAYEVQKLHGMGDAVHAEMTKTMNVPIRVYAPIGPHHDLLAYLVRRIIENGASSSFMNRLADTSLPINELIVDPYESRPASASHIVTGDQLYAPERQNSLGADIEQLETIHEFLKQIQPSDLPPLPTEPDESTVKQAFTTAKHSSWLQQTAEQRATCLEQAADLYEKNKGALYRLLVHEAGKTIDDAEGEVREAVDFCRYYALQAKKLPADSSPRGTVVTIAPWNFPLAIFTGQMAAALGAGNTVLSKPAEQTPRIAVMAVQLMHEAGIPKDALQVFCGEGHTVGQALVSAGEADMVVFTGSTATAKHIEASIACSSKPHAPLTAETGGLNAMIVDSSAILERAVDDILTAAFQSAGQRCSALRIAYMQDVIAEPLTRLVCEAAAMMKIGEPCEVDTDIGPVIDSEAKARIDAHIAQAEKEGRLIWKAVTPEGCFCPPAVIKVNGIEDLEHEIFGPVLHVTTYPAGGEAKVVEAINASGYGLTFGMHSRIDSRLEHIAKIITVGNVYINRNQIGAFVGSQPFGGHGLSGTGPKAGGPVYLNAFTQNAYDHHSHTSISMPGPAGEKNIYHTQPRYGKVAVIHSDAEVTKRLLAKAKVYGNETIVLERIPPSMPKDIEVVLTEDDGSMDIAALRKALHHASNRIIPLIIDDSTNFWLQQERHYCRDMTASGGNVDLLTR